MRAVAALVVAVSHIRAFVFVDFHAANDPGFWWSAFYFVTGFGHQAVVVFFVLSGFLVGGAVVTSVEKGRWRWTDYLVARMTRLWIVLVPALLLTALWDHLGSALTGSSFYSGGMGNIYNSGPLNDPSQYSVETFVGNLAFLQTIAVPTFGSNGPLWSLANEFWYYLLFPLLYYPIAGKGSVKATVASLVLALAICAVLPGWLLTAGLIWLFGVAAFVVSGKVRLAPIYRHGLVVLSGAIVAATLVFNRIWGISFGDFILGAVVAVMLVPLSRASLPRPIANLSHLGAEFSYTLYLTHFPLAAFVACFALHNQRIAPSLASAGVFAGMLTLAIVYAYAVYLLFERRTPAVRRWFASVAHRFSATAAAERT